MEPLVALLPLGEATNLPVDVLDRGGDLVQLLEGPAVGVVVLAADAVAEARDDGSDDDTDGTYEFGDH